MAKRETEIKQKYQFPTYTKKELWELNNLLKTKYNDGKKIDDVTAWLKDEGALNKDGSVIVENYRFETNRMGESYPVCDYPTKYEILSDKLSRANRILGLKEFAQKKEIEDLAEKLKLTP